MTKTHSNPQRILVTGASGAVGRATCQALLDAGHSVAGTVRSGSSDAARDLAAVGVHVVELDVTDDTSVVNGVAEAVDRLGGLDVLFNNAGIGSFGIQEMFSVEQMHRVFDVNVYGVQRVMRAALPHLRDAGRGTVLYTSSLIGRIAIPYYATYCASKWALEALAQSYRAELSRFGVDSCVIEPGAMPTPFLDRMLQPEVGQLADAYAPEVAALRPSLEGMQAMLQANPQQRPERVAEAVLALVDTPIGSKPFRVVVDHTGMGEPVDGYNAHLGEVTRGVYAAWGQEDMLRLNTEPTA